MFSILCFPFGLSTRPWRLCAQFVCLFVQQCTCLLLMELFLIHPKRRVWYEVLQSGSRLLCCAPVTRDTPPTCNHHLCPPRCPNAQNTVHTRIARVLMGCWKFLCISLAQRSFSSGVSGSEFARSLRFTAASAARSLSAARLRSGVREV